MDHVLNHDFSFRLLVIQKRATDQHLTFCTIGKMIGEFGQIGHFPPPLLPE